MSDAVPPTAPPASAIAVHSLSKVFAGRRGRVQALEDVTCEIGVQEFVSVLGPSGCGKSTLLRIIGGLIPYEAGQVLVHGQAVAGPRPDIGVVFQTANLLPWLTVVGNLRLGAVIRKLPRHGIDGAQGPMLSLLGLEGFERAYPHELSGGMQQRVALGQALLLNPRLLLMDEPFGALDALTRDRLNLELLRIWERERQTVLFVTHSIAEAIFLSDRVLVMSPRPGRILQDVRIELGRPRGLKEARGSREFGDYVVRLSEVMGVTG
jgi:NitT/TauT family transport system ATP-binding protein